MLARMDSRYDSIDLAAVAAAWRAEALHGPSINEIVPLPAGHAVRADTRAEPVTVGLAGLTVERPSPDDEAFAGFGPRERLAASYATSFNCAWAAAACGVSPSTLRRWTATGVMAASAWFPGRPRRWLFGDIVHGRTIAALRASGVSLRRARQASALLAEIGPGGSGLLRAVSDEVVVVTDHGAATPDGQLVFESTIESLVNDARAAIAELHPEPRRTSDLRLLVGSAG